MWVGEEESLRLHVPKSIHQHYEFWKDMKTQAASFAGVFATEFAGNLPRIIPQ